MGALDKLKEIEQMKQQYQERLALMSKTRTMTSRVVLLGLLASLMLLTSVLLFNHNTKLQKELDNHKAAVGKCIEVGWECAHMLRDCYNSNADIIEVEFQ